MNKIISDNSTQTQNLIGSENKYNFKTIHIVLFSVLIEAVLFYFYYFPETKLFFGDEQRYLNAGLVIADGGDWHTNPMWPPMQAVLIGLFVKIFGNPILPLQLFQYGLLLLAGFIVQNIVWRETKHKTSAQIALAVMILYPSWLAYSQYLWPEVIHLTLFVAIIWINRYKNHSIKWLLFSGVLLGLAILFKSILVLFVPFLYLALFTKDTINNWKQSLLKVILSILVAGIVIAPASIKAHKLTGSWMVSNSSMFNLWFALNDDKRQNFANDIGGSMYREYINSADNYQDRNTIVKNKAINKIQQQGIVSTFFMQVNKQYFRLFDYQSFFSQQFQGDEKENYVNKYHHRHDDILVSIILSFNNMFYVITIIAMFIGLIVSLKKSVKKSVIAQQFAWFLLYVLALFVLLHAKPRFRIPLQPLMAFYTAYCYYYFSVKQLNFNSIKNHKAKSLLIFILVVFISFILFAGNILDKYYPI